jgi:hypothetical protein
MALCSGNSPEKPGFFHTFFCLPALRAHPRCGREGSMNSICDADFSHLRSLPMLRSRGRLGTRSIGFADFCNTSGALQQQQSQPPLAIELPSQRMRLHCPRGSEPRRCRQRPLWQDT